MGIRFVCEKCSAKLHLKSEYAGRKTKCPKCSERIVIPSESTIQSRHEPKEKAQAAAQSEPKSAKKSNAARSEGGESIATLPATEAKKETAAKQVSDVSASDDTARHATEARDTTESTSTTPGGIKIKEDVLCENPTANWFVAPPSGGQFGPAQPDVMRQWISEGRVIAESLVWREGWEDWKPANVLFDMPQPPGPPKGDSDGGSSKPPKKSKKEKSSRDKNSKESPSQNEAPGNENELANKDFSDSKAKVVNYYKAKARSRNMGVLLIVGLAVVSMALVGLLVYVLMYPPT